MKKIYIFLSISILFLVGCNQQSEPTTEDLNKITLKLVDQVESNEGITYTVKLSNNSNFLIKQNSVYLSYNIQTEKGHKSNDFKILAKNNRLDIKPSEKVLLTIKSQREMYGNNTYLRVDKPYIEITGFIEEVEGKNMFHIIQPLKKEDNL